MSCILPSRLRRAALALALVTAPVVAITPALATQPAALEAVDLSPGQFVWRPETSAEGAVEIVISLPLQMAYVYRGGVLIGASTVSSGREGYETPTGSFEILQKRRVHHSNRYDNAPMPFMQRLTWDGIALHGGAIPGHPASHGCVRLPQAFARNLYAVTSLGAAVHITDQAVDQFGAMSMLRQPAEVQLSAALD
jgi:hypothetical protein